MAAIFAGVGYRAIEDAYQAGAEAVREAIDTGSISEPSLVLAFATNNTNPDDFLCGIRSVVGEKIPVVGGAAVGIITADNLSYNGSPVGVAVFDSALLSANTAFETDINADLKKAGEELIKKISSDSAVKAVLLFFDSMMRFESPDGPPIIPSSRPIMQGVYTRLSSGLPVYGAGLVGDFNLSSSFIFGGNELCYQSMVCAAISGDFSIYSTITHGCSILDGIYRKITRQQGAVIMELDDKPAVEVINEIYGSDSWQNELPVRTLTIGINNGSKYAPFNEEAYVNRLIAGILPDKSGIVLFEEGPQQGDEIQFLHRDNIKMMESARQRSSEILERIKKDKKRPVFALYINCAGRAASQSLTKSEEASIIQEAIRSAGIPLLGFYSGIELAPIHGISRGLDWTGVLMILAMDI